MRRRPRTAGTHADRDTHGADGAGTLATEVAMSRLADP